MPTPATLDIDALLAPIPGEDPSGGPVAYALRERLDQSRKEINPDDFDPRDPLRPAEPKRADWSGIAGLTVEALSNSTKDLLLVVRLIEAMTCLHGFAGLRDGLRLARGLVEQAWDRLRPAIEEPDDLEVRAASFNWLDDSDRGALFPNRVRGARLVEGPSGPISWNDWNLARTGKGQVPVDEIEKAVEAAPREACQVVADDIEGAIGELQLLLGLMNERMGPSSPSLGQLREAVFDCRALAQQVLARKGPAPVVDAEVEAEARDEVAVGGEPGEDPGAGSSLAKAIKNRAQAYQRLNEIADTLAILEPHSPIPFVIRRAIALGQLSFPELMKELIADANVLGEMSRNLGIKELS